MAFKVKTKNRNPINTKQTLDATHNEILEHFKTRKEELPSLTLKIDLLEEEIDKLRKKIKENNNDHLECMKIQKDIWYLEDQQTEIKELITDIETGNEEKQYLLKTGNILKEYYNSNEENELSSKDIKNTRQSVKRDKKSVLDWLSYDKETNTHYNLVNNKKILKQKKKYVDVEDDINSNNKIDYNSLVKIDDNVKQDKILSKKELYQKYMSLVEDNYVVDEDNVGDTMDVCENCNTEMLLEQNTGFIICTNCGYQENVIIDSDKPSYKDPPKEMTSFCYKRINHLNEFLAQFQAKETTEIPEEIYNEILVEIKKERIENMADITADKLRIILRKIKRNVYYEHRAYIINQLNGLPPPIISPEVEEIIRSMFKEIQVPFDKYCPKKRKNFLSYNYVMYKFFELLELDEYLHCFQLLKSRNKLHQQDQIWKNICKDVKWQFIPSL